MPAGQPRTFDSAEQLIDLWREFCDDIIDSEYSLVPTQTAFCRWLQSNYKPADRKTIYNSLNKYFPDIKAEFEQIQSDTVASGGMLGKYQPTMSIFALKNWCGWGDNGRITIHNAERQEDDALTASLKELAEEMNDRQ